MKSWLRKCAGRPFVFTIKVSELITHTRGFERTERLVRDFGHVADLLGPHMGCLLFQLPPGFDYAQERLAAIMSQLEPGRRNVVEFRHPSWWREEVYEAFRAAGSSSARAAGRGCGTS